MSTDITFGHWSTGVRGFPDVLRSTLDDHPIHRVCDVGGGASPALTLAEIAERDLDYTVLDISADELAKTDAGYTKACDDVTRPGLRERVGDRFDLVFSRMLAEHVAQPEDFHRNVLELLAPGGLALHIMPTMWDPAFVANRLLPERLTRRVLARLQPGRRLDADQAKFPAYYRWCRGPSARQVARLRGVGFEVLQLRGYFGTGYADRVPVLGRGLDLMAAALIRHPVPLLTSYTVVVLRRPLDRLPCRVHVTGGK